MARLQLALNVSDLDEAIEFYTTLFETEPAKVAPGYANFAVADPPLKLVLIEQPDAKASGMAGALNHLGVEVPAQADVSATATRLATAGLATDEETSTTCCYAVQDKVWVEDPDHRPWEVYTVLADASVEDGIRGAGADGGTSQGAAGAVRARCC